SGSFRVEWVAGFVWNQWQPWSGIRSKDTPLPSPRENDPILPSQKGNGLGKRQVQRTYEQAIDRVVKTLQREGKSEQALAFEAVKTETHYLRHTGASQAIEAGGDIRHISEELGHASPAITEAVYVRSDKNRMRLAGKRRSI
ncbi:tyrosine-type recombinase/integrase, partial [Marinobacter goseongensis]|uniref:tyrosine-type recombinase/integrase n=1 Tax=Marinobacter goseongensis TaxID=453838 RepID=UPI002003E0AF